MVPFERSGISGSEITLVTLDWLESGTVICGILGVISGPGTRTGEVVAGIRGRRGRSLIGKFAMRRSATATSPFGVFKEGAAESRAGCTFGICLRGGATNCRVGKGGGAFWVQSRMAGIDKFCFSGRFGGRSGCTRVCLTGRTRALGGSSKGR